MTTATVDCDFPETQPAIIRRLERESPDSELDSEEAQNHCRKIYFAPESTRGSGSENQARLYFINSAMRSLLQTWPAKITVPDEQFVSTQTAWTSIIEAFDTIPEKEIPEYGEIVVNHKKNVISKRRISFRLTQLKRRRSQVVILKDSANMIDE